MRIPHTSTLNNLRIMTKLTEADIYSTSHTTTANSLTAIEDNCNITVLGASNLPHTPTFGHLPDTYAVLTMNYWKDQTFVYERSTFPTWRQTFRVPGSGPSILKIEVKMAASFLRSEYVIGVLERQIEDLVESQREANAEHKDYIPYDLTVVQPHDTEGPAPSISLRIDFSKL